MFITDSTAGRTTAAPGRAARPRGRASEGALGRAAEEAGFTMERAVVEIEGVCPNCRGNETP